MGWVKSECAVDCHKALSGQTQGQDFAFAVLQWYYSFIVYLG